VTAVLLFAKAPRRGLVKTRLAADLGEDAALRLYRKVGARVATSVGEHYALTVWHDPPEAQDEMRAWLGEHVYVPQRGRDLGERLAHAFAWHFAKGDGPVIVIGADAPHVSGATVAEAERHLGDIDAVIGPSVDGGYYLLGLRAPSPTVFEEIPWSTDRVFSITVARCRACHLRVQVLAVLRDLDTAADLEALGIRRP
jgi:rSAM/selenodomain-associated transferase 1